MTGTHNLFRLYALVICDHCPPPPPSPGECRGILFLCLQFPIVTTTLWGQLAGKTMTVLPRSMLLYCTALLVYVYQTPTFPPHYGDNVKVKSQHICQAIPALLRGLGDGFFYHTLTRMIDSFSCSPLFFYFKISFQMSLLTLTRPTK